MDERELDKINQYLDWIKSTEVRSKVINMLVQ
jgi:hypothetical protein